jgi:hypothetical protein
METIIKEPDLPLRNKRMATDIGDAGIAKQRWREGGRYLVPVPIPSWLIAIRLADGQGMIVPATGAMKRPNLNVSSIFGEIVNFVL